MLRRHVYAGEMSVQVACAYRWHMCTVGMCELEACVPRRNVCTVCMFVQTVCVCADGMYVLTVCVQVEGVYIPYVRTAGMCVQAACVHRLNVIISQHITPSDKRDDQKTTIRTNSNIIAEEH